jgi:hypothetical protein
VDIESICNDIVLLSWSDPNFIFFFIQMVGKNLDGFDKVSCINDPQIPHRLPVVVHCVT